jgi:hypothetical protein
VIELAGPSGRGSWLIDGVAPWLVASHG